MNALPDIIDADPATSSPRIAQVLAQAFQDDPALSWIIPDARKRRKALPRMFAVMAEQSWRKGEVLMSADGNVAALWYPPGVVKHSVLQHFRDNMRLTRIFGPALKRGLTVAEAMHKRHPDPQTFAYLRYVGVAPEAQGKGLGGAIIREGIGRAGERGQGVLLETATPGNVAIYTRLGFAIAEEWYVPSPDGGHTPKFWTMIRPAD